MDLRRDLLTHDQEPPTFTSKFDLLRDCQCHLSIICESVISKTGSQMRFCFDMLSLSKREIFECKFFGIYWHLLYWTLTQKISDLYI